MLPYEEMAVRGILIDKPDGVSRYQIFCEPTPDDNRLTFTIPANTRLNQGQVKQAIRDHFGDVILKVTFPAYIKRWLLQQNEGESNG